MLNIKKAPTLAALIKGTSAGAQEGMSNSIRSSAVREVPARVNSYQKATCQGPIVVYGGLSCLTERGLSETVIYPKNVRGVAIAVSSSPTVKKVLPAYSACLAAGVFIGRLVHIGEIATSGTCEGPAVSNGLGSVVISPLFFNPKPFEVPFHA